MKTKKISWQAIAIVVLALVLIASIALGVSGAWFQDKSSGNSDATLGHAVTVKLQNVEGSEGKDGVKGWKNIYDSSKTAAYPGDQIIGKTQILMGSTSPALIRVTLVPTVQEKNGTEYKQVDLTGAITLEKIGKVDAPTKMITTTSTEAEKTAFTNYYNELLEAGTADQKLNWNKWLLKNMTEGLNLTAPAGETAGWIKGSDKMWYYSTVFGDTKKASAATSKEIHLFDKAELSVYLTNEVAEWKISIDLVAEAIQAAHANESTHPWNSVISTDEALSSLKSSVESYNSGRLA